MSSFFKEFKEQIDRKEIDTKGSIAREIREKINNIQSKIFD